MTRLLLVNDERLFLELEQSFVRRENCEVVTASTAAEAIDKAGRLRPDLVLLDVAVPRMDGLEVCATLKGSPDLAGIPVLLLTTGRDERAALDAGADGTITKPITRRKVLEAFRHFLHEPERVAERRPVRLAVTCSEESGEFRARSRDLSFTGMFVASAETRPVGSHLTLSFRLPRPVAGPIQAAAEVVRSVAREKGSHRLAGMGVRFLALAAEDKARINRYVREPETRARAGDQP